MYDPKVFFIDKKTSQLTFPWPTSCHVPAICVASGYFFSTFFAENPVKSLGTKPGDYKGKSSAIEPKSHGSNPTISRYSVNLRSYIEINRDRSYYY